MKEVADRTLDVGTTRWLLTRKYGEIDNALWMTKNGHFKLLEYKALYTANPSIFSFQTQVTENASAGGYLEYVQFLHDAGFKFTANCLDFAASNNHLSVVAFLLDNRSEGCTAYAVDSASARGHTEIVRLLHVKSRGSCAYTQASIDNASANGHYSTVYFLSKEMKVVPTYRALEAATSGGHLEVVRFLLHNTNTGTATIGDSAAASGRLELVQELHLHGKRVVFTAAAMDIAVLGQNMDIVQFLHHYRSEGCSRAAFENAVRNKDEKMLQFLLDYYPASFPPGSGLFTLACTTGSLEIVKQVYEYISTRPIVLRVSWTSVAEVGVLSVIQFLYEKNIGQCTGDTMRDAARVGALDICEYLHNHWSEGTTFTSDAIDAAATNGHILVVKFLCTHRTEGYTLAALVGAAKMGHYDVFSYLCDIGKQKITTEVLDAAAMNGRDNIVDSILSNESHISLRCSKRGLFRCLENGHQQIFLKVYERSWQALDQMTYNLMVAMIVDRYSKTLLESMWTHINHFPDITHALQKETSSLATLDFYYDTFLEKQNSLTSTHQYLGRIVQIKSTPLG
eukprot:gene12863-15107_t